MSGYYWLPDVSRCPSCGSEDIVFDMPDQVCRGCGLVVSSDCFDQRGVPTYDMYGQCVAHDFPSTNGSVQHSSKLRRMNAVDTVADMRRSSMDNDLYTVFLTHMHLPDAIVDAAKDMLREYDSISNRHTPFPKRKSLIALTVYLATHMENKMVGRSLKEVQGVYNFCSRDAHCIRKELNELMDVLGSSAKYGNLVSKITGGDQSDGLIMRCVNSLKDKSVLQQDVGHKFLSSCYKLLSDLDEGCVGQSREEETRAAGIIMYCLTYVEKVKVELSVLCSALKRNVKTVKAFMQEIEKFKKKNTV